jgi:hypothetical protein
MRSNRKINPVTYAILLMLAKKVRIATDAKRILLESKLRNYAEGAEINARMAYKEAKKIAGV